MTKSVSGKLPPHDLVAEATLLSAMILHPERIDRVRGLVLPEHFYAPAHEWIFRACLELADSGKPVDQVTVLAWLMDRGREQTVGGSAGILKVTLETEAISSHIEEYANLVAKKHRVRTIILEAQTIAAEGYFDVGDEDEWIRNAERRLAHIAESGDAARSDSEHIIEPTKRIYEKYLSVNARPQDEIVTTGFPDLDKMLSLEAGTFVVVGARSGRGKSSMSLQWLIHVAEKWGLGICFSGEMKSELLALRASCMMARVDSKRMRRGLCDRDEGHRLIDACNRLRECCAWINDRSRMDILTISSVARREVKRLERTTGKKVRIIVVDYLQRIRAGKAAPASANREQQVAAIAFEAKELAMELNVCVVMPAQLNADGDKRDDERPRVSDLRESKNIENEADEVILIHNPYYLARTENEHADLSIPEACEIIKGKGRQDGNGLVRLWFTPMWSRFDSMTDEDKVAEARRTMKVVKGGKE